MMMADKRQKIVFIVNPKAGVTPKSRFFVRLLAGNLLNSGLYEPNVVFTEYPGHATILAQKALDEGVRVIVAMGGDGTVNEIALPLINTDVALGILPGGSGNGLARELGLPMDIFRALKVISKNKSRQIDAVQINDRIFVSIAGIGFDAYVAHKFSNSEIRGLFAYMRIILKNIRDYKPVDYKMIVNGEELTRKALMISFANGKQFGFHARIAPLAQIDDGKMDICIISPLTFGQTLLAAPRLLNGTIYKSKHYETFKTSELTLNNIGHMLMNLDGEPVVLRDNVNMRVIPGALKVLVP